MIQCHTGPDDDDRVDRRLGWDGRGDRDRCFTLPNQLIQRVDEEALTISFSEVWPSHPYRAIELTRSYSERVTDEGKPTGSVSEELAAESPER